MNLYEYKHTRFSKDPDYFKKYYQNNRDVILKKNKDRYANVRTDNTAAKEAEKRDRMNRYYLQNNAQYNDEREGSSKNVEGWRRFHKDVSPGGSSNELVGDVNKKALDAWRAKYRSNESLIEALEYYNGLYV